MHRNRHGGARKALLRWKGALRTSLPQIGDSRAIDLVVDRQRLGSHPRRCGNAGGSTVPARIYSALAATVYAIIAILQFVRALSGWPIMVGSVDIPMGASWVACFGALLMAVLGYLAALRD
jgi:hypothetical protein